MNMPEAISTKDKPFSHHANLHGWKVEARVTTNSPVQLGDEIFDSQWRAVRFTKTLPPCGVPNSSLYANVLETCSLYGYEQAQALRWWFHASAPFLSGLETRLVAYRVKSDVEWYRDGEQEVVGERMGLRQPVGKSEGRE